MTLAARLAVAAAFAATALAAAEEAGPKVVCMGVSAAVTVDQVALDGVEVIAKGTWSAGGSAAGVLLEYRVDSDRMVAEARMGTGGSWETRITGKACGRHYLRVTALPLAPDGPRHAVCLANSVARIQDYDAECVAPVSLSDCEWDCHEGPPAACVGRCLGSVVASGGVQFVPQVRVGEGLFKTVDAPSAGPWWLTLSCSPGQKVAFRVHEAAGRRNNSLPVEIDCGR